MPWTVDDVERHHKNLSASKKRQWVAVANSVHKRCMENGGDESACAASAIQQANGVVNSNESTVVNENSGYVIRNVTHQGRNHIIVPVVMMRTGVHYGSAGPLLHTAEELGRFIESWNGIPVVVHHPNREGHNVSANSPDVIDEETVGRVYNTHMDGDKLCAEAWLDIERINQISSESLTLIQDQRPLDVSVGVFSEDDHTAGTWNGESYIGVARGYRPDHLALLPGSTGACSWEDGCGVRANAAGSDSVVAGEVSNNSNEGGDSDLEETKGTTTESKVTTETLIVDNFANRKKIYQEFMLNQADQGFRDIMMNIQEKLDRMDDDIKIHFLQDVFPNYFVYEVRGRSGQQYSGAGMYKRPYTVNNGVIEFTGEPESVRREVQYVSNSVQGGTTTMADTVKKPCCPQKVEMLIANEQTPYQDADRDFLNTLETEQIDKLMNLVDKLVAPVAAPPAVTEPAIVTDEQAIQALQSKLSTPEQFIALLPEEMRDTMTSALKLHQAKRSAMVATIKAASRYTDDQLKSKNMDELEIIADMVKKNDYTALGGGAPQVNTAEEKLFPTGFSTEGGN